MMKLDIAQEVGQTLSPNPQFNRNNWLELQGEWRFAADPENEGIKKGWFKEFPAGDSIDVPYVQESDRNSTHTEYASVVWYEKEVSLDEEQKNKTILLHFEAVDYKTTVWINGFQAGEHEGGHTPFKISYKPEGNEENVTVTVRAEDFNTTDQPVGKQSWKEDNFLCWYSRTTGIWQTVWMEFVNDFYLESVQMTPDIDTGQVIVEAFCRIPEQFQKRTSLTMTVYLHGKQITEVTVNHLSPYTKTTLTVDSDFPDFRLAYWTPESPELYDIIFTLETDGEVEDTVASYFGMRKVSVKDNEILLNNEKFYQKLILDQGYYKDTLMTAPDASAELEDIEKIKAMGFNGLRKHQTVGTHRFLYLCDKLGLVTWAEMPSFYKFHSGSIGRASSEWQEIIQKHYNHPSTIIYTIMNESWGVNEVYSNKQQQHFVDALYSLTKALDPMRLVIGNDGWEQTKTDILTIHDYTQDGGKLSEAYRSKEHFVNGAPAKTSNKYTYAQGYKYEGQPVLLSEFGGVAFTEQTGSQEEDWGYGDRPESKEEAWERISALITAVMDNEHFCGFCYTQLSDVQQEVNGLLTHDHDYKFDPEKVRKLLNQKHTRGFIFE
ncbi:glycoside hydrolase family 2 protein [Salipaludibacillus aurantiacus]|uniref:Glycosyl hydrolases family 2 n=1 Tax=Salipaludibacillus aurantiacus TaxID=1601833 RepID=A0A1H9Q610_9BACI|nr:sugar-binding domain-containing protein [Salipaludibacillus aurantiacus]SER55874.1 Glycosyl hydrolases family 2 [Salipaludibacillus aurantiacus]